MTTTLPLSREGINHKNALNTPLYRKNWARLKDSGFANTLLTSARNWLTGIQDLYRDNSSMMSPENLMRRFLEELHIAVEASTPEPAKI